MILTYLIIFAATAVCSMLMEKVVLHFLPIGRGRLRAFLPYVLFGAVFSMPSWVGDINSVLMFPFFIGGFYLCYDGSRIARLIVGVMFYSLLIPFHMIIDTFIGRPFFRYSHTQFAPLLIRLFLWVLIWLIVRHFRSRIGTIKLPPSLWTLLGGLSLGPLFTTLSLSIWTADTLGNEMYHKIVGRIASTTLPFLAFSSVILLVAMVVLSRHEVLEQEKKLLELREVYYQSLKREQIEVRTLRHDLHNHLTVAQSLLEQDDKEETKRYLQELSHSPGMLGPKIFCENEIANVILSNKYEEAQREGIETDIEVSLPKNLTISDIDLSALLGNALDNAIEAVSQTQDKHITVRARADKGMLMLRVDNPYEGHLVQTKGKFRTTKQDKIAHGFGLMGMEDIAGRYHGSLETNVKDKRFELVVYLQL